MLFIIVFSRQKQHFIPNTGNLTKGKQISLLLDPVKYSNGNEELQVKENNLHLKKEENIIFDNWTKPSLRCKELWEGRMEKVSVEPRLPAITEQQHCLGRTELSRARQVCQSLKQSHRDQPATGSPWLQDLNRATGAWGAQPAPSCSCGTGPRARRGLPPPNTDISFETVEDKHRIINDNKH